MFEDSIGFGLVESDCDIVALIPYKKKDKRKNIKQLELKNFGENSLFVLIFWFFSFVQYDYYI